MTRSEYDELGRRVRTVNADLTTTLYNLAGNVSVGIDERGNRTDRRDSSRFVVTILQAIITLLAAQGWGAPDPSLRPVADSGAVAVCQTDGSIVVLRASDGRELARLPGLVHDRSDVSCAEILVATSTQTLVLRIGPALEAYSIPSARRIWTLRLGQASVAPCENTKTLLIQDAESVHLIELEAAGTLSRRKGKLVACGQNGFLIQNGESVEFVDSRSGQVTKTRGAKPSELGAVGMLADGTLVGVSNDRKSISLTSRTGVRTVRSRNPLSRHFWQCANSIFFLAYPSWSRRTPPPPHVVRLDLGPSARWQTLAPQAIARVGHCDGGRLPYLSSDESGRDWTVGVWGPGSGSSLWKVVTVGGPLAMASTEGVLLLASFDGVDALSMSDGAPLWSRRAGQIVPTPVAEVGSWRGLIPQTGGMALPGAFAAGMPATLRLFSGGVPLPNIRWRFLEAVKPVVELDPEGRLSISSGRRLDSDWIAMRLVGVDTDGRALAQIALVVYR